MTYEEIKVGDFVHDVSNPIAGGRVVAKLKTKVKVYFLTGCAARRVAYDRRHCQFLRKEDR